MSPFVRRKPPVRPAAIILYALCVFGAAAACSASVDDRYVLPDTPPSEREGQPRAPLPPVEAALTEHAAVSAPPPEPLCDLPADCLGSAVALLRAGALTDAQRMLELLRERHPDAVEAARVAFLLGRPPLAVDFDQASRLLALAAIDLPVIADYVLYDLARGYRANAVYPEAVLAYDRVMRDYPDSLMRVTARFEQALTLVEAGDCAAAVPLLEGALADHPAAVHAPAAWLKLAGCAVPANDAARAIAALRRVTVAHPRAPEAAEAERELARLRAAGAAVEPLTASERLQRGKIFVDAGEHERALPEFEHAATGTNGVRSEARYRAGLAATQLRRYDAARVIFERIAQEKPAPPQAADALHWLARIGLRQNDEALLHSSYRRLEKQYKNSVERGRAGFYLGVYYEDRSADRARDYYGRVVADFGRDPIADEAAWRLAWLEYRSGRIQEAVALMQQRLALGPPPAAAQQLLYWAGRSYERLARPDEARAAFTAVCRGYARSFYCHMAADRLAALPAATEPVADIPAYAGMLPAPPRLPPPVIPERLTSERRWQAAAELRRLGLEPQAAAEIGGLVPRYADDRAALIGLGRLLYELGDYGRSLGLLRNYFGDVLERGGDEVPLAFWEQAYPVKLVRDIRAWLVDGSADPYLIASVMREESAFDRQAISKVGAIGLMQLMPYTAEWVAKQIGDGDYARERLFEAATSIRLGGWYLGHLGREFAGDSILTIASYNAGPEAVAQWRANRPDAVDEFIESIPYAETRNFTKRVLRSLREFRRVDALSQAPILAADNPQ